MKTVFTDKNEIAHMWAHQRQAHARDSASNFYFEGNTIYSYGSHFPIAKILEDNTILFTVDTYSSTTVKHIGIVKRAIPDHWKVIKVLKMHGQLKQGDTHTLVSINKNMEYYINLIEGYMLKQKTARVRNYIPYIKESISDFINYVEYYKLSKQVPKYYKFLLTQDVDESLDIMLEKFSIVVDKRLKVAQKEAKKLKAKQELAIKEWLNGRHNISRISSLLGDKVMLRLVEKDGAAVVETSKGIVVPASRAKDLFNFILSVKNKNIEQPRIESLLERAGLDKIEGWVINRVLNTGDIIAGCHKITWLEIERFAKKYKWNEKRKV